MEFVYFLGILAGIFGMLYLLFLISVAVDDEKKRRLPPTPPPQPPQPKQTLLPVDPRLYTFLEKRKLEHNLSRDFTEESDEQMPGLRGDVYKFNRLGQLEPSPSYIIPWQRIASEDLLPPNPYRKFKLYQFCLDFSTEVRYLSSIKVLLIGDKDVLIGPYFLDIKLYHPLNVFIAYTYTDTEQHLADAQNDIYNIFYFDIKGRYLLREQGSIKKKLPSIAFEAAEQKIIPIAPLPNNMNVHKIISAYRFVVSHNGRVDIIDQLGQSLLSAYDFTHYLDIGYNNPYLLFSNGRQTYRYHIESEQLEQLRYSNFYGSVGNAVMIQVKEPSGNVLWGLADGQGNELIKPVYNYIRQTSIANIVLVFIGTCKWLHDAQGEKLLAKILEKDYYLECKGKLEEGKWGLKDHNGMEILPVIYDWIESINENVFLLNIGGKAYAVQNSGYELSTADIYVVGGLWGLCDASGTIIEPVIHTDVYRLCYKYPRRHGYIKYDGSDLPPSTYLTVWDERIEEEEED